MIFILFRTVIYLYYSVYCLAANTVGCRNAGNAFLLLQEYIPCRDLRSRGLDYFRSSVRNIKEQYPVKQRVGISTR